MPDRRLTIFLSSAPILLMVAIVCAMWIRKVHRELPVFFSYMSYQVISAIALFRLWLIHQPGSPLYFYAYWTNEIVSIGLGFAVVYELFQSVLKNYQAIQSLARWLFVWATLVLVGVALLSAFDHGHETWALVAGALMLERSVRIVQAGLLLFLFVFAKSLGLTWQHCVLGVALGFACFVGSELTVIAWRMHIGPSGNPFYRVLTQSSFDSAVLIWGVYFLRPETVVAVQPHQPAGELARWNQALSQFLYR